MTDPKRTEKREGLSLQTLVIAAIASGTAAIVTSHFWKAGTAFTAAMTPVIVAILKELLAKPIESDLVRREVVKAGFRFDTSSDLLRHPGDDHSQKVQETGIRGKTDQFMLRFTKP